MGLYRLHFAEGEPQSFGAGWSFVTVNRHSSIVSNPLTSTLALTSEQLFRITHNLQLKTQHSPQAGTYALRLATHNTCPEPYRRAPLPSDHSQFTIVGC